MVVVVPEHRHDRDVDTAAGVREDFRLLGQTVRRQVAGQEHELRLSGEGGERALEVLPQGLRGMDVGRGGDADVLGHALGVPGSGVPATREPGTHRGK